MTLKLGRKEETFQSWSKRFTLEITFLSRTSPHFIEEVRGWTSSPNEEAPDMAYVAPMTSNQNVSPN